jgi:septal ring factor EnvC (AmiA/AmiB activator)
MRHPPPPLPNPAIGKGLTARQENHMNGHGLFATSLVAAAFLAAVSFRPAPLRAQQEAEPSRSAAPIDDMDEHCRLEAAEFQKMRARLRESDTRLQGIYNHTKNATDDKTKLEGLIELAGALLDDRKAMREDVDRMQTHLMLHIAEHAGNWEALGQLRDRCALGAEIEAIAEEARAVDGLRVKAVAEPGTPRDGR